MAVGIPLVLPPTLQTAEESGSMPSKSLDSVLRNVEKELMIDALKSTGGNIAAAARLLGTTERILGLRIKKYGFTPQKYRGES